MKINFKEVEENISDFPNRLAPGIHEVTVADMTFFNPNEEKEEEKGKSPYDAIKFVNEKGEHEERFYTSEKAAEISKRRLKHLALAMISEDDLNNVEDTKDLKSLLLDKKVRIKLSGREIAGNFGNFIVSELSWAPFAESISIPTAESALTFNEDTDIRRANAVNTGASQTVANEMIPEENVPPPEEPGF